MYGRLTLAELFTGSFATHFGVCGQRNEAAEQIEVRTTGNVSLNDERDNLVDPAWCHDESEEYAATAIQSHVRRFLIVRQVRSCGRASGSMQCAARRQWTLYSDQSRNEAAAFIQASMHSYRQRLKLNRNEESAVKLQTIWRAIATRDSFVALQTSTIAIQAWERRRQCLASTCKLRETKVCQLKTNAASLSATRIQCVYRRHAATRSFHTLYVGAVALQAVYRGIMARRLILFRHALVARARLALLVQTMWRGSRIRDQYALLRRSASHPVSIPKTFCSAFLP